MSIVKSLAAVMADVQAVAKNDRNQAQGFKFRGIDAVMNAVGPVLRKHGVVVVPELISVDYQTVEIGQKRTPMGHARIVVAYHFYGPEGDSITSTVAAEAMDSGDKATAKAMSVAFRTCLLQALCLPTDEPDPDSEVYERSDPHAHQPGPDDEKAEGWSQRLRNAESIEMVDEVVAELQKAEISEPVRAALVVLYRKAKERLA